MRFDPSRAPLAKLLDHYDAGLITLPAAVVAARRSVERLEAFAATVAVPDVEVARERLVADLTTAACGPGSKYPNARRLMMSA